LTPFARVTAAALVALCVGVGWHRWSAGEERAVRQRLDALTAAVNTTVTDGLGTLAHAADIGGYFTEDVVVDLGEAAAPIVGRATLVGMARRLQRRTAAFRLRFDDIGVRLGEEGSAADVTLTASSTLRDAGEGGESTDARELRLAMTKASGTWRISRITAVDTLR
jgi:hypothetical protein